MPTINGFPNYPKPVENREIAAQENGNKKAEEKRAVQAQDDAALDEIKTRDADQLSNVDAAQSLAVETAGKLKKLPPVDAVEISAPKKAEDVEALLT